MIARRAHIVLAAVVASVLVLAGCAVPGQAGAPGVAATYRGVTYDIADVTAYESALGELHITATSSKALTLRVLGGPIVELAKQHGFQYTPEQAASDASLWATLGDPTQPVETSAEAKDIATTARAIEYLLSTSTESVTALVDLAKSAEAEIVTSPRFGSFSAQAFGNTLAAAAQTYTDQSVDLGPIRFALFGQVNGFGTDPADWIAGQ